MKATPEVKVWKNTATLDTLVSGLRQTVAPELAEVALIGGKAIDLDAMPQLKGLFKCGVGTDNVPFEECARRGIRVGLPSDATANVIFEETASFAVSLVFRMLYADVGSLEKWEKSPRLSVSKKKVLVIGAGSIGRRVMAKLERTVQVTSYDVAASPKEDFERSIAEADVVSLHIPLTAENRGWIDGRALGLMKDGAALVNTSRGPIVDEDALYQELVSGRLRAAFDVFWQEPYRGKLAALSPDRFFMTPHVASNSRDFLEGLADDYLRFLDEF